MLKRLVEQLFGEGAWEDVDHEEVQRGLEREREKRRLDFERIDEYPYDHYTEAMEDIKQLKRERRHDEVEDLLLWCIEFAEAEARAQAEYDDFPMTPPAYYRHLGIVYRKDDRYADEVAVLERYIEFNRSIGAYVDDDLRERLDRARELASESD